MTPTSAGASPTRVVFLLDTPNIWRGEALAGTPARVLALATHARAAGTRVTLVLCDRGADLTYHSWPFDVVLAHPDDFYWPSALAGCIQPHQPELLVTCEAEALLALVRPVADAVGARLVYDVHDDEAAVAASLGEPTATVERRGRTQRAAFAATDFLIASTRGEQELIRSCGVPLKRLALLPNGADTTTRSHWGPEPAARRLLFVGNRYYEPNARAVHAVRDTIWPGLRRLGVEATVRVVGHGPAMLTRPSPELEFTGAVEDLDQALRGATVALAPLTAGAGAKMKMLDYLAAGLPVLATNEAVTGLPPAHPGVIVDDDLHAHPTRLAALLGDPHQLTQLGAAGRRCTETDLSWQRIGADLADVLARWRTEPGRARSRPELLDAGTPRWLDDHARHHALGQPQTARPGAPVLLPAQATCPTDTRRDVT